MAIEGIPQLQKFYDTITEENTELPDPNCAVFGKKFGIVAISDGKTTLWVEVVDPAMHRELKFHARDRPYFSCLQPFSGDCKLADDADHKCVVHNWLGTVWCSPMISLISTAKDDAASFTTLKNALRLFLSRVKGARWVDRQQVAVPVAATVSALRGLYGIMCHVPCAGGCTRDDVDFISPAGRGAAAAIITEIPVAGRILMTQVKDAWQDEVQRFHVVRVKDEEYSPALDLATQSLDDLITGFESKKVDVSDLVAKSNSILHSFLQLLPKLEQQRPLWHDFFLPVFIRVARAVITVKQELAVVPNGTSGALSNMAAVCKGIRKKTLPDDLESTLTTMVRSDIQDGVALLITTAAKAYAESPSHVHMVELAKKLAGQPSLPPSVNESLEGAFIASCKLLREGLELGFEICEARTTFLKGCEGRLPEDDEKYRVVWLGIFMEMTNVHKAEVEMAASGDLPAGNRDASICAVSAALRTLGDAVTTAAQEVQGSQHHNACYAGFMKSFGVWREAIIKNLKDNVIENVKEHARAMNSVVSKLKQISRGAAGGKTWFDGEEDATKPWLEVYTDKLVPIKKGQLQTLLANTEKA